MGPCRVGGCIPRPRGGARPCGSRAVVGAALVVADAVSREFGVSKARQALGWRGLSAGGGVCGPLGTVRRPRSPARV
uniref:NDP-hexose synthase n=1 Tax=Streptomyces paromomycinus TaxID=92743 RepID=Q2MFM2_STREY